MRHGFGFLICASLFILLSFPSFSFAANLILNPSIETASGSAPASWASDKWGTTKATFTYPTGGAQDGNRYLKTQITTAGTGDAKWYPAHITSSAGQTYTFTDWYQSTVASTIEVEVLLTNGSYQYLSLGTAPASATWSQFSKTFTTPANTKSITVFHYIKAVGTLSVDNYTLDAGSVPPPPPPSPAQKPVINSFTASPTTIAQGGSATLSWNIANASSTTIDQGIGAVTGTSRTVSPTTTTTYTITATNPVGSVVATVTVGVSAPLPPGANLILNPSIETASGSAPASWASDKWGTTKATFTYPTGGAQDGNRYLKTQITTAGTGDAKWYPAHITSSAGQTYTFTDWYQSTVASTIEVEVLLTNGSYQYLSLGTAPASATWSQFSKTFTTPANTKSITVFHYIKAVGTLSVDNYTLDAGSVPPPPPPSPASDLIANPSFEIEGSPDTLPQGWGTESWGTNTASFSYIKNGGHTGSHSARVEITSYTDGDAKWVHDALPVTPGDSYQFSDWYQSDRDTYVVIDFTKSDGSHYYLGLRPSAPSATWKQFTQTFQVPYDAVSMSVLHILMGTGTLTVDDYSLTKVVPEGFSRGMITLAFDDGWEEDTLTVLPVLNEYNYNATFFFASTFIENSPATGPINVSGPQALLAMQAAGHEIGGHSVTHPDLAALTSAALDYELTHSKEYLESIAGPGTVKNLATPFGTYNNEVITKSALLYGSLRSTDEGYNLPGNFDKYRLMVQNMQKTTTMEEFQSWVDQAKKDKSWLILVYHRVATTSLTQFDTPEENFRPQMEIIKASGLAVLTTEEALQEIEPQVTVAGVTVAEPPTATFAIAVEDMPLAISGYSDLASLDFPLPSPQRPVDRTGQNHGTNCPCHPRDKRDEERGSGI